jgi:von Willebrand factor type D domain
MRRVKFWLLGATGFIVTFLFEGFFRKIITVGLCGVLTINSGIYTANWLGEQPVMAAQSIGADKSSAQAIVTTFRQKTAKSPWNFDQTNDRGRVADRLTQLIDQPTLLNQGFLNLCGPAAFFYIWFRNDPVAATRFATEMYDNGESAIGDLKISARGSLLARESHQSIMQKVKPEDRGVPLVDWMLLSALRNSENDLPYTGNPTLWLYEGFSGGTQLYELEKWLNAADLYDNLERTTEDLATNPDQAVVAILIATHLLSPKGQSKHFIVPESKITVEGNQLRFRYWTWGRIAENGGKYQTSFDRQVFQDNKVGALVIKQDSVKPPVKKKCTAENSKNDEKCKLKSGRSGGDPHLVTFDGSQYGFQTVGEFTLVKSNDDSFEVQVRQSPFSSSLSVNRAVAVKVGADRVALYAGGSTENNASELIRVNGKLITLQGTQMELPNGGEILKDGSTYVINAPSGEKVLVSPGGSSSNPFFNISPFVYNQPDQYSGLLGNMNGNPKDDFQMRGGRNALAVRSTYGDVKQVLNQVGLRVPGALDVTEKLYFDQLYKEFGKSWRITPDTSLFDYPAGKTTQDYVLPGFPERYLTLNMLSSTQIEKAQTDCRAAKVAPDLMEACLFDVGFSGMSEFALAAAEVSGYVDIVNQLFPSLNVPKPDQLVNQVIQKVKPNICLPFVGCL